MPENQSHTNFQNNLSVLITGGSGLVGKYITSSLISEGYSVSYLSRGKSQQGKVRIFRWDPGKNMIDSNAFDGIDCIIHLAGANIGEKRWTNKRKEEILRSRVDSAGLIYKTITEKGIRLKSFISASAIGYYGSVTSDQVFKEEDPPGDDFLGSTCRMWEEAADQFGSTGARVVKIRTGVVLERGDSALSKLLPPARLGVFPRLGSGRQYMPWIHIADLCGVYLKAIQDENIEGPYNAVSPQHSTQSEFIKTLARVMKRPFFHLPVPGILLSTALGEMADVILKGSRVSSEKIKTAGYSFHFPDLQVALENVISK